MPLAASEHVHHRGPQAMPGVIASNPATDQDEVQVKLPGFDGGMTRFGPCRWMPRGGTRLPQRGDPCVVVMVGEADVPWVLAWWPYG